jgi:sterol desaturase/sphingolipid hydroxylase (fatty acid hydroxylase superfamily)
MNAAALALRKLCASRINYRLSFVLDAATPLALCFFGVRESSNRTDAYWLAVPACLAAGAFVFTFIEYGMHRWLFHARASFATASHRIHHFSPQEPSSLPFPCSALAAFLIWGIAAPIAGGEIACFFSAGVLFAYFYYGLLHHLQHRVRIGDVPSGILRKRWTAHAIHHGRLEKNYGVTTSLWDHVFGTYHGRRTVTSRRRIAL